MSSSSGFLPPGSAAWRLWRCTLAPGQGLWLRTRPGQVACVWQGELQACPALAQAGLDARWAMDAPSEARPQRWQARVPVPLHEHAWWWLQVQGEAPVELLVWQRRSRAMQLVMACWPLAQRLLRWPGKARGQRGQGLSRAA